MGLKNRGDRQIVVQQISPELISTSLQRANVYRFFSLVFSKEPTEEFISEITKTPLKNILSELGVLMDDVFYKKDAADQLSFEYIRLFIGIGPKHIPPYESVFADSRVIGDKEIERLMWGPSTVAVDQFYKKLGYQPEDRFKDMPDHLGVELGFMEQLCLEEAAFLKNNDLEKASLLQNKQKQFLGEHLLRWIDDFATEVNDFAKLKFYSSCAKVAAQFLKRDCSGNP